MYAYAHNDVHNDVNCSVVTHPLRNPKLSAISAFPYQRFDFFFCVISVMILKYLYQFNICISSCFVKIEMWSVHMYICVCNSCFVKMEQLYVGSSLCLVLYQMWVLWSVR